MCTTTWRTGLAMDFGIRPKGESVFARFMTSRVFIVDQHAFRGRNPNGVAGSKPRVVRRGGLPWVRDRRTTATPTGLRLDGHGGAARKKRHNLVGVVCGIRS
jgi:hypothetical protein